MIERHVTFNVFPGKEKEFEALFKEEYSVAMSRQPGFVSVTLLKEHQKEAVYQMVIRFQSLSFAPISCSSLFTILFLICAASASVMVLSD